MKLTGKKVVTSFLSLILIGMFSQAAFSQENEADYTIGTGDMLEVSVWNHPELTRTVRVRPDGWITCPLIGEMSAAGVQPAILTEQVRGKLLAYLKDPKVSVIVTEYNSKKVLVIGEVKKPGLYQFEGGMTAFDAIGLADGYNKHAQLRSIMVVRNGYSKVPECHLVNLYRVIHDGNMSGDLPLQPRDIVYIPQNFIGNAGDALDFFMARIRPAADTYFLFDIASRQ